MKGKIALVFGLLLLLPLAAAGKDKDKEPAGQAVDAGSFGVFVNGHRLGTETFSIQQTAEGSVIDSEFKSEQGLDKAHQTSELQLSLSGDLRRYEWKETSPEFVSATVVPRDNFLFQQTTTKPGDKPAEQPYLLPASTSILDDYFFVQREVLLWKYLAIACRQDKGILQCPVGQRTQFGAVNPHSRSSLEVSVEFVGAEKIPVHGVEQELAHFNLKSESGEWAVWLDIKFKLMRIVIASENTEVVRD